MHWCSSQTCEFPNASDVAPPLNSKIIANHPAWSGCGTVPNIQRSSISWVNIPLWLQSWITNLFHFYSSWLLCIKEVLLHKLQSLAPTTILPLEMAEGKALEYLRRLGSERQDLARDAPTRTSWWVGEFLLTPWIQVFREIVGHSWNVKIIVWTGKVVWVFWSSHDHLSILL